jgi:hypothetical protein
MIAERGGCYIVPAMQIRFFLLVSLFVALLASAANAQRIRVSLKVDGPDDTKNQVFSYLVSDLAQRGCDLVGRGADFEIKIIASLLEKKKCRGARYAVSVAVIAPVPKHGFTHPLVAHFLEVAPPNGLQELCKRLADEMDTEVFAVHRRSQGE